MSLRYRCNTPRGVHDNILMSNDLPTGVCPAVSGIEHCKHRAALRALPDLTRPGQELGLATPKSVHRDQDELAIERLYQLGTLERHGVVSEELIEAQRRRPGRGLHPIARRVGPLLLGLGLLPVEREPHAH